MTPLESLIGRTIGITASPLRQQDLQRFQGERLCRLVEYCRRHSPFYRQKLTAAGIQAITGLDDLTALPLTNEEELRNHSTAMLCVSQDAVARIITIHSSGTTGSPKRLFFTQEDLERTMDFFCQGMKPLAAPGQTVAILLPGSTPDCTGHLLAEALRRRAVASSIIGLVDDPEKAARRLSALRPDVLVGFPVQVLAIARTAAFRSIPLGSIRSVLLCSDYIPESLRTQLTGLLACEVFTHYGTVETGLGGGVDCSAHCGAHLREADLLFEIIDPQTAVPVADGEWGEIVFTTLLRTGMPLIRYRTGDCGRLLQGPCPCGSHIRRLDRVLGRISQRRNLQNGRQLALHSLDEILFAVPGLLDFRAALTAEGRRDRLLISLVSLPGQESAVRSQAAGAMVKLQTELELEIVFTIDTTAQIHQYKRILEERREKNRP